MEGAVQMGRFADEAEKKAMEQRDPSARKGLRSLAAQSRKLAEALDESQRRSGNAGKPRRG